MAPPHSQEALCSRTITAPPAASDQSNDQVISYTLRSLSESEVSEWAAFCASVFAYKSSPPPASYFERHYYNDPWRQARFIRVACCQSTNEIVASCRIFVRYISMGKGHKSVKAGGIGEVCTSQEHRKRGLSKELLSDCVRIMMHEGITISFLHSAPTFFPVYQAVGYQCTRTRWTHVPLAPGATEGSPSATIPVHYGKVRPAEFPKDTVQLMRLHAELSEDCFQGCIIRSHEYWEMYVANELEDTLRVMEDPEGTILGWMSLRQRGSLVQMREFGLVTNKRAAGDLVRSLLEQALLCVPDISPQTLAVPTLVYEHLIQSLGTSHLSGLLLPEKATSEDDLGWMYKSLDGTPLPEFHAHLIWPTDSF